MTINNLKNLLPEEAFDIKENIDLILESKQLSEKQKAHSLLAAAYSIGNKVIADNILEDVSTTLTKEEIRANKIGVTLMGMNNVYYRFIGMTDNNEIQKLRPKLKMSGLVKHKINPADFETILLASSCIGICEHCIKWHTNELLKKHNLSLEAIQDVGRIAAVLKAVNISLSLN